MRIRIITLFSLICVTLSAKDNSELATALIPETLTMGANSVVRKSQTQFILNDKTRGSEIEQEVITVLNEKGLSAANFVVTGDQYRTLKQFSATIYNALGKEIKQYKKSDVATTQWSANLTSDDITYYWNCPTQTYPFTIVFNYEVEWKNGICAFPFFMPQEEDAQTVQEASYTLQVPLGTEILSDGNQFVPNPTKSDVQNATIYKWVVKNIAAIDSEPFAPTKTELTPFLYLAPKQFYYDGYEGNYESIKSMGDFQNKLNEGRNTLTEATKQKLIDLTKNAANDKEKVKILYDYLGANARYESIQLGIGGWQPISSGDVCKNNFGDCKGLSFYLKSMLEAVGIPSNYTAIRMDENHKRLKNNFTAFFRTNHVILQVPLPNDTLWLECTAANRVPFGFVHNGIAGHDAIVVTKDGGKMQRLPEYEDSLNTSVGNFNVSFNKSDPSQITATSTYSLEEYDDAMGLTTMKPSEQIDAIRQLVNIPNAAISQFSLDEDKSPMPKLTLTYKITASPYGTSTGSRYFLPLNPFRKEKYKFRKKARTYDIEIPNGHKEVDNIELNIPDNLEIEYLPASLTFNSIFGTANSSIKQEGKTIHIKQNVLFNKGRWTPDKYNDLIAFFEKLTTMYSDAIVLKEK